LILETIAMAFHRPAFTDPLDQEHFDDFLQALKDTQAALRTGALVDRQTRHVIRKAIGGWRDDKDQYLFERPGADAPVKHQRQDKTKRLKAARLQN
jgi:hypothetical protein